MKREPRNVTGYRVQQSPDGCHNCNNRYYGMVRWPGNQPIVSCKLACLTPDMPAFCDETDPMGKCDSWSPANNKAEVPK